MNNRVLKKHIAIFLSLLILVPTCLHGSRSNPTYSDCLGKQNNIMGALEMFMMDASASEKKTVERKLKENDSEYVISILFDEKYIGKKALSERNYGCSYSIYLDELDKTGIGISCKAHGNKENIERYKSCGYGNYSIRYIGISTLELFIVALVLYIVGYVIRSILCFIIRLIKERLRPRQKSPLKKMPVKINSK